MGWINADPHRGSEGDPRDQGRQGADGPGAGYEGHRKARSSEAFAVHGAGNIHRAFEVAVLLLFTP